MKNIYILSDAHLGSLAIEHGRMHERRLVRFLDDIKHKAAAVYLLGKRNSCIISFIRAGGMLNFRENTSPMGACVPASHPLKCTRVGENYASAAGCSLLQRSWLWKLTDRITL